MNVFKEDVELGGFDEGGQDVLYGDDFLNSKTVN